MHPSLQGFTAYPQFVVYLAVPKGNGKDDKLPVDILSGKVVSAHESRYWLPYETAKATADAWGSQYGVGFVFTENDPFWFLDIDNCLEANGQWSALAAGMCQSFPGCAIEISRSGKGLHIFGTGVPPAHGCRNNAHGLEFYHAGRFVALTGSGAVGDCRTDASAILPAFVAQFFPPDAVRSGETDWTDGPCEEWNGPKDDRELLRRAMQSKSAASAFGTRASFADLWLANEVVLAGAYPDANGRTYDLSAADAALAQHLSFWTGRDCERIRRLMEESGLKRDKWERSGDDYLGRTILGAVGRGGDVLQEKTVALTQPSPTAPLSLAPGGDPSPTVTEMTARPGSGYLTCDEQLAHFAGCIYVMSHHRVFIPGGLMLKPEQFKVMYGGFQFHMDPSNEKMTRDAWEAWTQSQAYRAPTVHGVCFKPDRPPGEIVSISGQTFVNTYFPVAVARTPGDVTPFLNHLAKVLPAEVDSSILIAYMAACVQHQGVKFQWAPLIQGVEGNGKTLFARCVAEAIGRRYVHWPNASKLAEKFNGWMMGKTFFAVEDVYVPDARREVIEQLKPMITGGDGLEIEAKGMDQISADICGNFMFNSNHKDAIRKTANDRRFCLLFSAQQNVGDLKRDGLDGDYFPNLYKWLRDEGGYAIVSEFLWTYDIPARFNPATDCQRAPVSTSTGEAISASSGHVEQEIEEAIAQGLQGFAGGWISSYWLDKLLERIGVARRVNHLKRKEILEGLGYIHHPALPGGRVNNTVYPDGTKSRLFVKKDSLAMQITTAAGAAKEYESVNTIASSAAVAAFGRKA